MGILILLVKLIYCLSLIVIGYTLGSNELLANYISKVVSNFIVNFTSDFLPAIVTGIISSILVSLFFIYKEEKNKMKIVAPKLNKLLTVFRIYYTAYMLTPLIKPDIGGFKGYCEDAFEHLPSNQINFRALYERSRYSGLHHIGSFSSKHELKKCLSGLEEHPHLDSFLYISNIEVRRLITELETYSYCLDENVLSILFDIQNCGYIMLYDKYSLPSSGTWQQISDLYEDVATHGENSVLDSKYLADVKYIPSKLRDDIFDGIDSDFKYYFKKMESLQIAYNEKYK